MFSRIRSRKRLAFSTFVAAVILSIIYITGMQPNNVSINSSVRLLTQPTRLTSYTVEKVTTSKKTESTHKTRYKKAETVEVKVTEFSAPNISEEIVEDISIVMPTAEPEVVEQPRIEKSIIPVESKVDLSTWESNSIELNAMDVYDKYNYDETGMTTGNYIPGCDVDIPMYDNMPWKDDGNWYIMNTEKCSEYLENNLGVSLNVDVSVVHGIGSSSYKRAKSIDGVICMPIAATPIMAFGDTDETGYTPIADSGSFESKVQGVIVLGSIDGVDLYVPVCACDIKYHSWPGGITQTFIGMPTRIDPKTGIIKFNSNHEYTCQWLTDDGYLAPIEGMKMSIDEFRLKWKNRMWYNNEESSVYQQGIPCMTTETNYSTAKYLNNLFSKGYYIKEFIFHKCD